jgi:hypothetical protein
MQSHDSRAAQLAKCSAAIAKWPNKLRLPSTLKVTQTFTPQFLDFTTTSKQHPRHHKPIGRCKCGYSCTLAPWINLDPKHQSVDTSASNKFCFDDQMINHQTVPQTPSNRLAWLPHIRILKNSLTARNATPRSSKLASLSIFPAASK